MPAETTIGRQGKAERPCRLRLSDAANAAPRLEPMRAPPIPQRMPPLAWRKPALLWTPLALALAIGWPAAAFSHDVAVQRVAIAAGAVVFALALVSLGASWALGRAPRARRVVVLHVVVAGALASVAAPFVMAELLTIAANHGGADASDRVTLAMSLAMTPLALVLGLPAALVSGIVFAWVALTPHRARRAAGDLLDDGVFRNDVQPFR
jgi:hypothetical protein